MTREEQREKASVEYQLSNRPMAIGGDAFADMVYKMNINPSFIAGAKWSDEHPREGLWDKDKVCRWIKEHLTFDDTKWYTDKDYVKSIMDEVIEDLTKAMER